MSNLTCPVRAVLQGGAEHSSLPHTADDAGVVLRATYAVVRGLSVVPKAKYALSVSYCGLTVGQDAQLIDLLASPSSAAASVSLRDGSAAAAMAGLTAWAVEDPCDIIEVGSSGARRDTYTQKFSACPSIYQGNRGGRYARTVPGVMLHAAQFPLTCCY